MEIDYLPVQALKVGPNFLTLMIDDWHFHYFVAIPGRAKNENAARRGKKEKKRRKGRRRKRSMEGGAKYLYVNEQHTILGTVWLFFFSLAKMH